MSGGLGEQRGGAHHTRLQRPGATPCELQGVPAKAAQETAAADMDLFTHYKCRRERNLQIAQV